MAEIGPGELAYKQRQNPSLAHSREISEAFRFGLVLFGGGRGGKRVGFQEDKITQYLRT